MFLNYLKTALRNMAKRKFFTFVNALGLSIGIALCLLIFLYIQDERKFDAFHTNADHIVRLHWESIGEDFFRGGSKGGDLDPQLFKSPYLPARLADVLHSEASSVLRLSHFSEWGQVLIKSEKAMARKGLVFVSEDFLRMFDFGMIAGDSLTALSDKNSVVLTESMAAFLFGDEDPLRKTLIIDIGGDKLFTVTGVTRDVPTWSSLDFDFLVNVENRPMYGQDRVSWLSRTYPIFVQLEYGADRAAFQRELDLLMKQHMGKRNDRIRKELALPDTFAVARFSFVPLQDVHYAADIPWHKVSDQSGIWVLLGMGLSILFMACANYVMLAISIVIRRAKEVGIRRTFGAFRKQLMLQFYVESVGLALLSLFLALALVVLLLPAFNAYAVKSISLNIQQWSHLATWAIGIGLVAGFAAGSYPALFMSQLGVLTALRGGWVRSWRLPLTHVLVIIQFSLSAFLLISSSVQFMQMKYVKEKNLGFDQGGVVVVQLQQPWNVSSDVVYDRYRRLLGSFSNVESVGGMNLSFTRGTQLIPYTMEGSSKYAFAYRVDPGFVDALKLEVVQGRNFLDSAADSLNLIVNEALVKDLGWADPIGKTLPFQEGGKIIGVVKDFHFQSLTSAVEPAFLNLNLGQIQAAMVRLRPGNLPGAIEDLERAWKEVEPGKPFEYSFLDEDVAAQYGDYERWTRIMGLSTFFAVLIACLGLFGLAGVSAANRTKEVGIRKVLGARVWDVVYVLNRPFALMAAAAFALAAPAAQYAMARWLGQFEYAVALDWRVFAASFAASLVLALATVSFHAFRAAGVNPVETLKCE